MFVRIQLKHFIQIADNCSLVFIIFINFLTKKLSRTSTFLGVLMPLSAIFQLYHGDQF
jgi:hypothetical protein